MNATNIDSILFSTIDNRLLIKPAILSDQYPPEIIRARNQQVTELGLHLANAMHAEITPTPILITGPSGSGKTVVVTQVLNRFVDGARKRDQEYCTITVDCRQKPATLTNLCRSILLAFDPSSTLKGNGHRSVEYQEEILSSALRKRTHLIIVLDHLEAFPDPESISEFLNLWSKKIERERIFIQIIGIVTTITDRGMSEKFRGITNWAVIEFPRYTAPDLIQILADRIPAFREGAIGEVTIDAVAGYSQKKAHGDARWAISLLQRAAEYVQSKGRDQITDMDIESTVYSNLIITPKDLNSAKPLSEIGSVAFIAILAGLGKFKAPYLKSGFAYGMYKQICEASAILPKKQSWFSTTLRRLRDAGYIAISQDKSSKIGVSRKIHVTLDLDKQREFMKNECKLKRINPDILFEVGELIGAWDSGDPSGN